MTLFYGSVGDCRCRNETEIIITTVDMKERIKVLPESQSHDLRRDGY